MARCSDRSPRDRTREQRLLVRPRLSHGLPNLRRRAYDHRTENSIHALCSSCIHTQITNVINPSPNARWFIGWHLRQAQGRPGHAATFLEQVYEYDSLLMTQNRLRMDKRDVCYRIDLRTINSDTAEYTPGHHRTGGPLGRETDVGRPACMYVSCGKWTFRLTRPRQARLSFGGASAGIGVVANERWSNGIQPTQ